MALIIQTTSFKSILIYDIRHEKISDIINGHIDRVNDLDWSMTSEKLISGSSDGTCRIWKKRANNKFYLQCLAAHPSEILMCKLCPKNENILVTAGNDSYLNIWNILPTKCNLLYILNDNNTRLTSFAFNYNSTILYTGNCFGRISKYIFRMDLNNTFKSCTLIETFTINKSCSIDCIYDCDSFLLVSLKNEGLYRSVGISGQWILMTKSVDVAVKSTFGRCTILDFEDGHHEIMLAENVDIKKLEMDEKASLIKTVHPTLDLIGFIEKPNTLVVRSYKN
ncbi:hypothetical protein ACOME3_000617 [Neoechinorhynchus agilis]